PSLPPALNHADIRPALPPPERNLAIDHDLTDDAPPARKPRLLCLRDKLLLRHSLRVVDQRGAEVANRADMSREGARIDAGDAGDTVFLQVVVDGPLRTPVRRLCDLFTNHKTGDPGPAGLVILVVDAV